MKLGEVSLCEGDYFLHLAQYEKARQEFTEAITAYDRALEQAPDNDEARHNKGLALQKLGEVQASLAQYPGPWRAIRRPLPLVIRLWNGRLTTSTPP